MDPMLPAVRLPPEAPTPVSVPAAPQAAKGEARASLSEATLRAYRADWRDFAQWCRIAGVAPLPAGPEVVAAYVASLAATHGRSTLRRRLAAIGQAHRLAGHGWTPSHPAIRATLRQQGTPPSRRSAALTMADLRKLLAACDGGLTGLRDRALLLIGFAGALRRSQLVGIDREHISFTHDGLRMLIPRAKSGREGAGAEIRIPYGERPETCPVRALEAWLEASDTLYGPVFRKVDQWGTIETGRLCTEAVWQIVRRRARQTGLTVPPTERLSPHGLRAGFITEAHRAGERDEAIMRHARHADLKSMRHSIRHAQPVADNPAKPPGL